MCSGVQKLKTRYSTSEPRNSATQKSSSSAFFFFPQKLDLLECITRLHEVESLILSFIYSLLRLLLPEAAAVGMKSSQHEERVKIVSPALGEGRGEGSSHGHKTMMWTAGRPFCRFQNLPGLSWIQCCYWRAVIDVHRFLCVLNRGVENIPLTQGYITAEVQLGLKSLAPETISCA